MSSRAKRNNWNSIVFKNLTELFIMIRSIELANGREWKTYTAAYRHFSEMLGRYQREEEINDPDDHSDLCALLKRYESILKKDNTSKVGCGVQYFTKQNNSSLGWSSDGFWLHRIDGSICDFSFKKALGPLPVE